MNKEEIKIKGGVIIMGSLFWENEKNCLKGDTKGNKRPKWRNENLELEANNILQIALPTRYGRCSSSRICSYTMVLSSEYIDKKGTGLIVPYISNFISLKDLRTQIEKLAIVEGICKESDQVKKYASSWGVVAIWLNPKKENSKIIEYWNSIKIEERGYKKNSNDFVWSDNKLINDNYELQLSIDIEDIDFLLCTYIKPKHKNIQKDIQMKYPDPKEIADAMITSGYQTYFCQNRASGIVTSDDDEIISYLTGNKE